MSIPEPLASAVLDNAATGLVVIDSAGRVVGATRAAESALGREAPVGTRLADLGSLGADLAATADELGAQDSVRNTAVLPTDDGQRWFDVGCRRLPNTELMVVWLHDVTLLLDDLGTATAAADPVTGLPGRESAEAHLGAAAADLAPGRGAVMVVELDQHDIVTRALGPEAADELVRTISHLLAVEVPESSLIARLSPRSFAVVHTADEEDEFHRRAARVRDAVRQPVSLRGRTLRITASVGTSVLESADDGIRALDRALSAAAEASERGGNRCVVRTAGNDGPENPGTTVQLWNALRTAVQFRNLEVWYQPIVSLATGRPVGVEALCRWHHPQMGDIAPSTFIPLAEQNSEILAIDAFVHDRAAGLLHALRSDRSLPTSGLGVVINTTASELAWPGYAAGILQRVESHALLPEMFVLDVPGAAVLTDERTVVDNLRALADAGLTLSLDDFGTGTISLPRVLDLGIRRVTIDRGSVARMIDDPATDRLVTSMVALAAELGMAVVAKGVETQEQLTRLRAMGCRAAQGFLFAPAVTELEIASVLADLFRSAS